MRASLSSPDRSTESQVGITSTAAGKSTKQAAHQRVCKYCQTTSEAHVKDLQNLIMQLDDSYPNELRCTSRKGNGGRRTVQSHPTSLLKPAIL